MEKQDFEKKSEAVKDNAIRLETSDSVAGGCLYRPKGSRYAYIFTVLHAVLWLFAGPKEKLFACFQGKKCEFVRSEIDFCTLYPELETEYEYERESAEVQRDMIETIREELGNNLSGAVRDAAVLRVPAGQLCGDMEIPLTWLAETGVSPEEYCIGNGYPGKKEFPLPLSARIKRWNPEENYYDCQAVNIKNEAFSEAMRGFSGTGLFVEFQGSMVLTGLVKSCEEDEKHRCFKASGISELIKAMDRKGWEVPASCDSAEAPEQFWQEEIKELFDEDIKDMEDAVASGMKQVFYEIDQDNRPSEIAHGEKFYDIPVCASQRIACPNFWAGYLWHIYLKKVWESGAEGDEKPGLTYICTEGEEGKADLSSVVASAVRGKVLGGKIRGDCILVWQSRETPNKTKFKKTKFKRIVADIAEGKRHGMDGKPCRAGYDLLYGEMKEKNYGILHIKYLLQQLDECETMEEAERAVKEVLDEIWE